MATEKATFCPLCKHMHIGICEGVRAARTATTTKASGPSDPDPVADREPPRVEVAREALAKFDKSAYQREYMRRWRAKK